MALKEGFIRVIRDTPIVSVLTVGSLLILMLDGFTLLDNLGLGFMQSAEDQPGSTWLTIIGLIFIFGLTSYILVGFHFIYNRIYKSRPLRVARFNKVSKILASLPPEQRGIIAAAIQNWSPRIEVERSALKHAVRLEHAGVLRDLSPSSEEVASSRRYVIKRGIWEALLTDPELVSADDAASVVAERHDTETTNTDASNDDQASESDGPPALKSSSVSVRMADTAILGGAEKPADAPAPAATTESKSDDALAPAISKPKLPPMRGTSPGSAFSSGAPRGRAFPGSASSPSVSSSSPSTNGESEKAE